MKTKDRKVVIQLISTELQKRGMSDSAAQAPEAKSNATKTPTQSDGRWKLPRLWRKPQKQVTDLLGLLATVIALGAFFFSFFPHLTLSEPTTLNEAEFFSKSFTITNDGILPVWGIRCGLTLGKITRGGNTIVESETPDNPFGAALLNQNCRARYLAPGDSYTFTPELGLRYAQRDIQTADFGIMFSYIPLLPPLRMQNCVHFKTYVDTAGKQHWFRSPGNCERFRWWLHPSM